MSETRRWFDSIQTEIEEDYADAQATHKEDIQRSGHEGESTWADLLAKWLPPAYGVGLRKYVIGTDDAYKPFETDIVIFEPAYPQHLRYRTKVHAGGVAAAFSVKLTARKKHINEMAAWAASLSGLSHPDQTTVEGQLLPGFPTGFLAHSHDLGSDPIGTLSDGFDDASDAASHPRELLDLVCIADAGTLACQRMSYISMSSFDPTQADFSMSSYLRMNDNKGYGAVAHFIVSLYGLLGRKDPSLLKLATQLGHETETGQGQGKMTKWDPAEVFNSDFLASRRDLLFDHGNLRAL
jgi:hypothetical protein